MQSKSLERKSPRTWQSPKPSTNAISRPPWYSATKFFAYWATALAKGLAEPAMRFSIPTAVDYLWRAAGRLRLVPNERLGRVSDGTAVRDRRRYLRTA